MFNIGRQIGDAYLAWIVPQLAGLSPAPVTTAWSKGMGTMPGYPTLPRSACPRLLLRLESAENELLVGRGSKYLYRMSLWVQLVQTPGQDHQAKLLDYCQAITSLSDGNSGPASIQAAGAELVVVQRVIIHDELRHQFDDPRLRVSVGEIQLEITSRRYP